MIRLRWVVALLAVSVEVFAQACPPGEALEYRVSTVNNNLAGVCIVGEVLSEVEILDKCGVDVGETIPGPYTGKQPPYLSPAGSAPGQNINVRSRVCIDTTGSCGSPLDLVFATAVTECTEGPPPGDCDDPQTVRATFDSFEEVGGAGFCFNGCISTFGAPYIQIPCVPGPCSPSSVTGTVTQTNIECSAGDPPHVEPDPEVLPDGTSGACHLSTGMCVSEVQSNCGYVNDEYQCLEEQLIHDCISTESGGLFCGADALDQPDNGTPGQPGDPDGIFGLDGFGFQFEQVNYYSSSTVESSSNHGDGLGPGEGEGECDPLNEDCTTEGTATASGHCKNPPSCSDVGSVFCAILRQQWSDTCRSLDVSKADGDALRGLAGISESDQDMLDGMRQSVDVEAAFGVEIPGMSAVACPAPMSIMVMGETIDIEFDVYCEFFRYLGVFVVISSTLLAFRIAFTNQG